MPADVSPRVSVVVPVRDRRELLAELLGALAVQTYKDFEVVVVDDGSTDDSGEEAARPRDGLRVRVVRTPGVGAVEARRRGVAAARGEILAFTDSDCVPDERWLEVGVAALGDQVGLVQGATRPARTVRLLERSVWSLREDGLYATCNVFYRRDAFVRAGGFDDAGRQLGFRPGAFGQDLGFGEDALLGWRVRRASGSVFESEAVVRHQVLQPPVREILRRTWMAGAFPALVREIPELRDTLLQRRYFLGSHRLPLYVAVASLGLGRRNLAAAGAVWWAASRTLHAVRRDRSKRRLASGVPVELAADVVMSAALVWGSIKARTVVL